MPDPILVAVVAAIAAIAGVVVGFVARRVVAANAVRQAEHYAQRLVTEARAKQKEIVLEGKDQALQLQRASEEEAREKRATLQRTEGRLLDREEALDRKVEALERREVGLEERLTQLEGERQRVEELR